MANVVLDIDLTTLDLHKRIDLLRVGTTFRIKPIFCTVQLKVENVPYPLIPGSYNINNLDPKFGYNLILLQI